MSDLLLLKEKNSCPICAHNIKNRAFPLECPNCGMMLFLGYNDFELYEKDTGWREYWVYHGQDGWKHRTHILDFEGKPLNNSKALSRCVDVETRPPITPKEKIAQIRQETKAKQKWFLEQKKKIRSFGK